MTKVDKVPPIGDGMEPPTLKEVVGEFMTRHGIDNKTFEKWRVKAINAGKPIAPKGYADLSPDEYIGMCVIMDGLYEEGFFEESA